MANREALRELQSRLASRLQTARAQGVGLSWLAVEAAGNRYLLPLHQSGEIFPWESAHPVPYTQAWFLGVANLRGGLFSVVELAGFIAMSKGQGTSQAATRTDNYLVAFNTALEVNCALLVEKLVGLRSVDSFARSSPPDSGALPFFGNTYADEAGAIWQEIDLQQLASQPHFLSISA